MRFAGRAEEIVMRSIEKGVNYFDTAWIYPGNEETLGSILAKNNVREKVFIATKLPLILFKSESRTVDFDKYFAQSLERLKTNYIDYYLLHMVSDMEQWSRLKNWGIEDWIQKKKKSGAIRQIGFSFHGSGSDFLEVIDAYDWEMAMIQYNYFDENFQAGVRGLRAASKKMPVVVMEPLLGGRLAAGLPNEAVKIFKNADKNLSPAGWALNWLWDQAEVTSVLSGMNTMDQLEENISLAQVCKTGMLNEADKSVYSAVLKSLKRACKIRCTGCNYCMPCPIGVNIPGSFSAYNAIYSMGFMEGMKQYATSTGLTQVKSTSPSICTQCGKCEPLCPQKIPIIKDLKTVSKKMEPWWVKLIGISARAFLGKKRNKNK